MRNAIFHAVVAAGIAGWLPLAGAESASAATGDVAIDQVPSAARAAIEREAGDQPVKWVQRGTVDGHTVYTARIRQPGLDKRVVVGEDGAIVGGNDVAGTSAGGEDAKPATGAAASRTGDAATDRATTRVGDATTTTDHLGIDDVPAAVKSTVEHVADGRAVDSIQRERRDGAAVYRVRLAGDHQLVVDQDGGVLGGDTALIEAAHDGAARPAASDPADRDLQKDIALDQAPQPVQDALKTAAGGEPIKWVQRDTDNGQLVYRARIRQDGLDKRVTVAPDGKVLDTTDFSKAEGKAAGAWAKTKEVTKDAWDKTKEGTSKAWDKAAGTVGDHPKLEDLPAAVRTTIDQKAGDREIRDVKHELKDGKHVYDAKIHVKDGPDEHVIVDEDGSVVGDGKR